MPLGRGFKGRRGIYRIDAETGDASGLLPDTPGERSAATGVWSLDGKSVYIVRMYRDRKDTPFAFIERDLPRGTERGVIRRRALGGLNISPDGQYIATPSGDEGSNSKTHLLVPVPGGEPRERMRMSSQAPA